MAIISRLTVDKVMQDSPFNRKWGVMISNSLEIISHFATGLHASKTQLFDALRLMERFPQPSMYLSQPRR